MPDKNWQFEPEEYIKQGEPLYIDMDIPFLYSAIVPKMIRYRNS